MSSHSKSRLIVVSLRLPFVVTRKEDGTIGRTESRDEMYRTMSHVVLRSKGSKWIGNPGISYQKGQLIPHAESKETSPSAKITDQTIVPVYINQIDRDSAYIGCCKSSLWPLLHSMADRAIFSEDHWEAYMRLNHAYAEETLKVLRTMQKESNDDAVPIVWIHDYHLMVVANIVRRVAKEDNIPCKIAFFMHSPFPPYDMIKILPHKDVLLQGILGADLVSFQCEDYCLNFMECCARGLGTRVDRTTMLVEHDAGGRPVKVRCLPISVTFGRYVSVAGAAKSPKIPNIPPNTKVILTVDAVDYTKGLNYRLNAFERFLDKYPAQQGKAVLVLIVQASGGREYQQIKETLDNMVYQINIKFSTDSWTPVHYIQRPVYEDELAGFQRDADVALATPLRDGMNLFGKEFVACRIHPHQHPGVLILSKFVGAADQMQEALMVNPYEIEKVADGIQNALTMDKAEAEIRMVSLRNREQKHDLDSLLTTFMKEMGSYTIQGDVEQNSSNLRKISMSEINAADFDGMLKKYIEKNKEWKRLCLLLDYDGTLAPCHPQHPDLTVLPDETKAVLERLANMPEVFMGIITGRSIPDIKQKVGIKGITYAGNHGLDIVHPDGTKFMLPMPDEVEEKISWLLQRLQAECCHDGSWVENKGTVLAFHHEAWKEKGALDPLKKEKSLARAEELIQEAGFKIGKSDGGVVTEAKPPVKWDKGNAAIYILKTAFGIHWSDTIRVIFAGDDVTDEDAMRALKGMAFSFRVTNHGMVRTIADHRLPDTKGVLTMLKWVERFMTRRANNY